MMRLAFLLLPVLPLLALGSVQASKQPADPEPSWLGRFVAGEQDAECHRFTPRSGVGALCVRPIGPDEGVGLQRPDGEPCQGLDCLMGDRR